jgi:hypothetical protein
MAFVGDVVRLKVPCLGNSVGTLGVCYEEYRIEAHRGASFIFVNGNYDGFSMEEQMEFLEYVRNESGMRKYKFQNVMMLAEDFRHGMFAASLKEEDNRLGPKETLMSESSMRSIIYRKSAESCWELIFQQEFSVDKVVRRAGSNRHVTIAGERQDAAVLSFVDYLRDEEFTSAIVDLEPSSRPPSIRVQLGGGIEIQYTLAHANRMQLGCRYIPNE